MCASLLPSKLNRPRLGPQVVPRLALLERLDAGLDAGLTLLSAPAGFGKTTLVAEWLAHLVQPQGAATLAAALARRSPALASSRPPPLLCAWFTVDEHDNDPLRFWTYVTGALYAQSQIAPSGALTDDLEGLLSALHSPHPPSLDAVIESLLALLQSTPAAIVLVIDDYHHIQAQLIHDSLHAFCSFLPPRVNLLLLTRADPPLPLYRWRAHGQLHELRAADLCFSAEEAGAMLSRRSKLVLPAEMVQRLVDHTDGWPAGLQLLAASLQGRNLSEVHQFVESFTGSNRYVLNYLLEEVLQSQPGSVRDFLLRTSILPRMNAALCHELLDDGAAPPGRENPAQPQGARAILAWLEARSLFLIPLDDERGWYRYYHLFAEALQEELERGQPELAAEMHRRASRWFSAHGHVPESISHAVLAQDWELAADALVEVAHTSMMRGEFAGLFRSLDALPLEVVEARPRLALTRGWLLLFRGPLQAVHSIVERLVAEVQQAPSANGQHELPPPGELAALRASLASSRWEVRATFAHCAEALRLLPATDMFSRSAVYHALGHASLLAGNYDDALRDYQESITNCRQMGASYMELFPASRLAQVLYLRGELAAAARQYRAALQTAHDRGGANWPVTADALLGLAQIHYDHNDLQAAEHFVRRAIVLGPARSVEVSARSFALHARISIALNRHDDSMATLAEAARSAHEYNNPHLAEWLSAHQARCQIVTGDLHSARLWAQSHSGIAYSGGYLPEFEEITLARFALAERRPRAALALLNEWEVKARANSRLRCLIEIRVLQAVAYHLLNQRSDALAVLQRALLLAEAENVQRIFLDEGPLLAPLLEALSAEMGFAARLTEALHAQNADHSPATLTMPLDRLTPRELEILRSLARGASNQEVADTFVLTVGTVKGHVNHILSKLGARNRTEAVARARELGLL